MKDSDKNLKEKKFKRRFLAGTLGGLIVINVLSLCDFSVVKFGDSSANISSTDITTSYDALDEETETAVKQAIINAFRNLETQVPMDSYNISCDIAIGLVQEVIAENPEFFYVNDFSTAYFGNYYRETGILYCKRYDITYNENASEIISFIEQTADEIVAGIDDSMTDTEKALYVHDYIVSNYSYDTRIHNVDSNGNFDPNTIFDIYNFFKYKTGVCQAYTAAYKYVLQHKLNIPVTMASSWEMGHMWNVIQLDGEWYHVDVTWDDPEPDRAGGVEHKYFLLSDSAISADHKNWSYSRNNEKVCSSDKFDSFWWRDVITQMFRVNGKWFTVDPVSCQISARDINTGASIDPIIPIENDTWLAWNDDSQFWMKKYTTLLKSGNVFIYNTTEDVYAINVDGTNKRHVIHLPKEEHNGYRIYGLQIDENGDIYAILQNNPYPVNGIEVMTEIVKIANTADIDTMPAPRSEENQQAVSEVNWTEVTQTLENEGFAEISMPAESASMPAEVIQNVKGKDVELVINVGAYQWSVNGLDVTDETVSEVNLNVTENAGIVPDEITNMYTDGQPTVEINLQNEGKFGYEANLKVFVGTEFAGKSASVLQYKTDNSKLEYNNTSIVDENGYAVLSLQNAANYMVIMDDKPVGLPGDADNDGQTILIDYMLFKRYLIGAEPAESLKLVNIDMDGDGDVTIKDSVSLAKQLLK